MAGTGKPPGNPAFVKGMPSANPKGRPPGPSKDIKELAGKYTDVCIEALVKALARPESTVAATALLLAYAHGRPANNTTVRVIKDIAELSDAELRVIAGLEPAAVVAPPAAPLVLPPPPPPPPPREEREGVRH
jgi:hypothetical protein